MATVPQPMKTSAKVPTNSATSGLSCRVIDELKVGLQLQVAREPASNPVALIVSVMLPEREPSSLQAPGRCTDRSDRRRIADPTLQSSYLRHERPEGGAARISRVSSE